MRTGVFAGSFCPITRGHVDAIEQASKLVDKLYVVVGNNCNKKYAISDEGRLSLCVKALKHIANVEVVLYDGMMTDFCIKVNADVMIKSIRNAMDTQSVIEIKDVNDKYWDGLTVFVVGNAKYRHISSTLVRELVQLGKPIDDYVPDGLSREIIEYLK